jgi:GTP-binding protein
MMKNKLPIVAIVGRMNVGKSTLFNRLSDSTKSIAYDYAGVTRDLIMDTVCWRDACFTLVDTGGIRLRKIVDDPIAEEARRRALTMIEQADVVLFMCDGSVGILPEDRELAIMIQKKQKPAILIINKIDTAAAKEQVYEFERLGFKTPIAISAQHGTGIADIFDAILAALPSRSLPAPMGDVGCKVVIIGKPNVGKSSLLNLLVKKERAIVADIPGTTREPIKERVQFYNEAIELIDTPGIRRKRGVTEPIEQLMVKSAFRVVEDADVVLLVLDASQARMVDQELKLAFYVFQEQYKGLIILFNKDDLMDEQMREDLAFHLEPYAYFLDKVVQLRTSCITQKNVGKLMGIINEVCERYQHRFSDAELTILFKDAVQKRPLFRAQQELIVYRAQQVRNKPITIELVVSEPRWFGPSQMAYFEGVLRNHADLKGAPVRLVARKRSQK